MFILRRYCLTGKFMRPRSWRWQAIKTFEDEQRARETFGKIVSRNGYSSTCRGYELLAPQGAIMSAWDYRR